MKMEATSMTRISRNVPMVVALLLLGACTVAGSPAPSATPTPTPGTPASSPARPSPSSTERTQEPTLAPLAPSAIDPVMVLRVDIRPDVSFGRIPMVSVFRDGSVLRRSDYGADILRLTPDGLAEVIGVAADSNLLRASGDIGPDPAYQGGYTTYTIWLAQGETVVRRSVTNSFVPARRAEVKAFIALAEHLAGLETWLPASEWLTGPAEAEAWVPGRYLVKVLDWGYLGDVIGPVDLADVAWPFGATPLDFGTSADVPALDVASARCAVVGLTDARQVESALGPAIVGQRIPAAYVAAELSWAARSTHLAIGLHALLPDDPSDCGVDECWP